MPAPIMDFKDNGDGTVTLFYHCISCDNPSTVIVNKEKFDTWKAGHGGFIQDVFPELSPGDREILISGTHSECFDAMFAEEEDQQWPNEPDVDFRPLDSEIFPDGGYTA
jgi:hypothetical protein